MRRPAVAVDRVAPPGEGMMRWDLGSGRGFASLLGAYLALHALLRLWIAPTLNIDDARETLFAQTLQWGYQPRQPPLYNWLVWGAFRLLGPGLLALTLLKYAVLGVGYAFVYASARQVLADGRLAALGTFALILLLPIGWFVHDDLTHSVAVLATSAATLHALLRLREDGRSARYVGLGVALGLGVLSKFTFLVFAGALGLAALTLPVFRRRLLDPRLGLTLGIATLLVLPYALWFDASGHALLRLYAKELRIGARQPILDGVLAGLGYVVRATLYYVTPLALAVAAVCPRALRRSSGGAPHAGSGGLLVERHLLVMLGLLGGAALLNLVGQLKFRWAIPFFFVLPLYAAWRLERAGTEPWRLRRLAGILVAVEGVMVAAILLQVHVGLPGGKAYRLNAPYETVGRHLHEVGFRQGTVVAGPGPLGGNLRLAFPAARVLSLDMPHYLPPASASGAGGQCLIAWERGGGEAIPPAVRGLLTEALDVDLGSAPPIGTVGVPYRHRPARVQHIHYVLLPQGAGRCR